MQEVWNDQEDECNVNKTEILLVEIMEKILKEWIVPCTWNGWGCKDCDNRTITNKLGFDGFNFYTISNGNGKNCILSKMDTSLNVGEILKR